MMKLDVIISQNVRHVEATCPLFPKCKGIGNTKPEALENLSRSIANHMAQSAQTNLKKIFLSNNYAEVLMNPKPEARIEHRLYNLSKPEENGHQELVFKLKPLPNTVKTSAPSFNLSHMNHNPLPQSPSDDDGALLTPVQHDEDYLFGFQISLN